MINYHRAARNIRIIKNLNQQQYPSLHELLYRRRGGLFNELLYMLEAIDSKQYLQAEPFGGGSFYQRIGYFSLDEKARTINRSKDTWHYKLILLLAIGLLKRDKPNDDTQNAVKKIAVDRQRRQQAKTERKIQPISFWYCDSYTQKQLKYCDIQAKKWIDSKATFTNFTKETVIRVFGEYVANRIYQDGRKTTKLTEMAYTCICEAIANIVSERGYASVDDALTLAGRTLFNRMKKPPDLEGQLKAFCVAISKVHKEWSKQKRDALSAGGYQYRRPTNEEKNENGIVGNEWIITKLQDKN